MYGKVKWMVTSVYFFKFLFIYCHPNFMFTHFESSCIIWTIYFEEYRRESDNMTIIDVEVYGGAKMPEEESCAGGVDKRRK